MCNLSRRCAANTVSSWLQEFDRCAHFPGSCSLRDFLSIGLLALGLTAIGRPLIPNAVLAGEGNRPTNLDEDDRLPGPKSPQESLAVMYARPGFRVELMVAEPLVTDPIAFDWGPDGRLWVVEMGDYPRGLDGKGKRGGEVRVLEDTDGDGRYDKSTVFLDDLGFPTGVAVRRNGILVTAAPDILYAEDTDGDGKADRREVLFKGFAPAIRNTVSMA